MEVRAALGKLVDALDEDTVCLEVGAALGKLVDVLDGDTVCLHHDKLRNICQILFGRMFQIISGTSKTVSGTQNVENNIPNTAHTNVPTISVLLGTLFLLAFPVIYESSKVDNK